VVEGFKGIVGSDKVVGLGEETDSLGGLGSSSVIYC